MLNEWILFMGYLKVLDDVGERRINRARQAILEERLADILLTVGDAKVFMPLKLSARDLAQVAALTATASDPKTRKLLDMLRMPYRFFYDFDAPWSIGELRSLCEGASVPVPEPDDA